MPTFLFDLSLGLDVLNIPSTDVLGEMAFDGKLSAKAILALQDVLGHDAVAGSYRTVDYSIFRGKVDVPEWGIPYVSVYPFGDPQNLYEVSANDLNGNLEEVKYSYETVGEGDIGVMMNMMSPFSTAAAMRGVEAFMMDLLTDTAFAGDLISFGTDLFKVITEELRDVPKDAMLLVAPYDNADLIGLDAVKTYAIRTLHESADIGRADGLPIILHPHGSFDFPEGAESLNLMLSTRPDCFYYGEGNDPADVKKQVGGRCSLAGGVDTFTTIHLGSEERVRGDVNDILTAVDGDMIFTCSCSVYRGLPMDNMKTMMSAVREFNV